MAERERVVHFDGEGLEQSLEVFRAKVRSGHAPIHEYRLHPYREGDGTAVPLAVLSLEEQDKGLEEVRQRHGFAEWDERRGVWYPDAILHLHEMNERRMPVKQVAMLTFAALNAAPEEWARIGLIRRGGPTEQDEPLEEFEHLQARVAHKWDNINLMVDPGYVGATREVQGLAAHALRMRGIYVARYLPAKEGSAA